MPRAAVLLDRDNTLIHNAGYLGDPDEVRLLPGAAHALGELRRAGLVLVSVSNQSGVGRGYFTEDDVRAVNRRMDELLRAGDPDAVIDRHYFCPFHPDADVEKYRRASPLRKPKPGMLLAAARDLGLDLSASWMVGDSPRDVEAGRAAGCRTVLLADPSVTASPHAGSAPADVTVTSLADVADVVLGRAAPAAPPAAAAAGDGETLAVLRQIERHLCRRDTGDFSLASLLAGVTQVLALALLLLSFLTGDAGEGRTQLMVAALFTQVLTLTLVLMGRRS